MNRLTLPRRTEDWPEDWRHRYEERAGIMEYHGGLKRAEAEAKAEQLVRNEHWRGER